MRPAENFAKKTATAEAAARIALTSLLTDADAVTLAACRTLTARRMVAVTLLLPMRTTRAARRALALAATLALNVIRNALDTTTAAEAALVVLLITRTERTMSAVQVRVAALVACTTRRAVPIVASEAVNVFRNARIADADATVTMVADRERAISFLAVAAHAADVERATAVRRNITAPAVTDADSVRRNALPVTRLAAQVLLTLRRIDTVFAKIATPVEDAERVRATSFLTVPVQALATARTADVRRSVSALAATEAVNVLK